MSHKHHNKKTMDLNETLQHAVEQDAEDFEDTFDDELSADSAMNANANQTHQAQQAQQNTSATPSSTQDSAELEAEVAKWKDVAMRSQAEMENLRKRTQIDIEKAHRYANASFAKDLLPVADYLTGAIDCAQKEIEKEHNEGKACEPFLVNLLKGVEMTQKQLQTVFEHHQIKKMDTVGLVFDPNYHKVIQEVEDADKEPGTVLQELQTGYTIGGDRVLREAMVIVSK